MKKGDKVYVPINEEQVYSEGGKIGTVLRITHDGGCDIVFEDDIGGHDCGGLCKFGHGVWRHRTDLIKVPLDNPLNRKLYPNRIEENGYLVPTKKEQSND